MTTSDEFKQQLRAGKIVDALTLALTESVELKITTWVSSTNSTQSAQPAVGSRIRTRMNIVEGAIDNEVGSQFIGNGPYTELRQFHMDQVKDGRQIIQHNLENLQKLFTVLTHTLSQLPQSPRRLEDGNRALSPSSQDNMP
ncbi:MULTISPECIES: hypothetical protein [unclassified Coleofasciculus]|uniref:hypothetical protein n=1 Tax=unclassified Coleofasciculus TaxID=2692782 RepID=UPI0018801CEB|nr:MULTISPECIES: hypothetical protein [unclassified Coleofasciculus]MBE9127022.1 hypothetical protein [Coleofasciculus sp. LEGE 07081]MBE9149129.1 hypothetical protein [Coleofasciculus sp. LEGE 07092]